MQTNFEIWAQLKLCREDCKLITDFFIREFGIKQKRIIQNMHLTVYSARRPLPGVWPLTENIKLVLPTQDIRFMVMAPGGENPTTDLIPAKRKIGIRVHRQSCIMNDIREFRTRLLKFETQKILGKRLPSTNKRNAFGSRYFQPHVALLRAGNGVDYDLIPIGNLFREKIKDLTFDKFIVDVVKAKIIS